MSIASGRPKAARKGATSSTVPPRTHTARTSPSNARFGCAFLPKPPRNHCSMAKIAHHDGGEARQPERVVGQCRGMARPLHDHDGEQGDGSHAERPRDRRHAEQRCRRASRRDPHFPIRGRLRLEHEGTGRIDDQLEQHDVDRQQEDRAAQEREERQADDRHVHREQVAHRPLEIRRRCGGRRVCLRPERRSGRREGRWRRPRGRRPSRARPSPRRRRRRAAPARR